MGDVTAEVQRWFAGQMFDGPDGRQAYGKYWAYALPTLALVFAHAQRFGTVLHAGGHIGLVPLALATGFTQVRTYEVASDNYAWLVANTAREPRIQATYGALGDGQPVAVVRAKYSACHYAYGPGTVPCFRIDDLRLTALDALVLDVEGGEGVALRHGLTTLRAFHPLIVVEEYPRWMPRYHRHPGDVARLLVPLGYTQVGASPYDLAFAWRG